MKGYEKELSTTDAKISLEGMDPHLFRTDRDFYIDHMLKNKGPIYLSHNWYLFDDGSELDHLIHRI